MIAPNVVSVAVIVFIMALAQGLSEQLPALGKPWVPFAVVALGALLKGLQVILKAQQAQATMQQQSSSLRRWMIE